MRHIRRRRSVRAVIVRRALAREDVSPASIARASGVSIDRAERELRAVSDLRGWSPEASGGCLPGQLPGRFLPNWRAGHHWFARLFLGVAA